MPSSEANPQAAQQIDQQPSFPIFLQTFKDKLRNIYHDRENLNQLSAQRGLPPYVLREVMACNPFSTFIGTEFGGRRGSQVYTFDVDYPSWRNFLG